MPLGMGNFKEDMADLAVVDMVPAMSTDPGDSLGTKTFLKVTITLANTARPGMNTDLKVNMDLAASTDRRMTTLHRRDTDKTSASTRKSGPGMNTDLKVNMDLAMSTDRGVTTLRRRDTDKTTADTRKAGTASVLMIGDTDIKF